MGSLADNIVKRLQESRQGVPTPPRRKRLHEEYTPSDEEMEGLLERTIDIVRGMLQRGGLRGDIDFDDLRYGPRTIGFQVNYYENQGISSEPLFSDHFSASIDLNDADAQTGEDALETLKSRAEEFVLNFLNEVKQILRESTRVTEGQIPLSSGADRFDQVVERLYYFNDTYLEASEFIDRSLRERGIDTDRVDLDEIFRVLQLDVLNTLYVEVRALVANKRTVQMERKA